MNKIVHLFEIRPLGKLDPVGICITVWEKGCRKRKGDSCVDF